MTSTSKRLCQALACFAIVSLIAHAVAIEEPAYEVAGSGDGYVLLDALARDGIRVTGEPMLARFNGPFTPWFFRRNEVQVSVALPAGGGSP